MRVRDDLPTEEHAAFDVWLRDDENGEPVYTTVECGEWFRGEQALCPAHEAYYAEKYPQGWDYYPGDRCVHGKYVGGCGPDYMCDYCEMGLTKPVRVLRYRAYLKLSDDTAPMEMSKMGLKHDFDAHPATVKRLREEAWARQTLYWVRDAHALQAAISQADATLSTYMVVDEITDWREE